MHFSQLAASSRSGDFQTRSISLISAARPEFQGCQQKGTVSSLYLGRGQAEACEVGYEVV
jgi:hypothetical protein